MGILTALSNFGKHAKKALHSGIGKFKKGVHVAGHYLSSFKQGIADIYNLALNLPIIGELVDELAHSELIGKGKNFIDAVEGGLGLAGAVGDVGEGLLQGRADFNPIFENPFLAGYAGGQLQDVAVGFSP